MPNPQDARSGAYRDFLSMYPTVCSLMDVWGLLTSRKIDIEPKSESGFSTFFDGLDSTAGSTEQRGHSSLASRG